MSDEAREPLLNVGLVCEKHAPKPGSFTGQDPSTFIGKHVKLGFPALDRGRQTTEHMWVMVTELFSGPEPEQLVGFVNNDPVLECAYKDGDAVAFAVSEIEAVDEDE
jgi:hypothetical protein